MAESEMVRRVASAIACKTGCQMEAGEFCYAGDAGLEGCECMDAARAAIEAMRAPTKEMLAGQCVTASEWRDMIEAALAERPP